MVPLKVSASTWRSVTNGSSGRYGATPAAEGASATTCSASAGSRSPWTFKVFDRSRPAPRYRAATGNGYSMPRRSLQRLFHHDDRLIHVRPDQFGKFIRQEIVDPD